MSDEHIRNPQMPNHSTNDPGPYEHEDLSPRGVIYFMIGLAALVVVIYFIVYGMYNFLDTYDRAHQPPISPMVTPQADTRAVTHDNAQAFPEPRLEENERTQLRQFIEDQDRKLATYNWVDKDKDVVQIPIDRAMDLIVERGLAVRQENSRTENAHPESSTAAQGSAPAKIVPARIEMKKQTPKTAGKAAADHGN